MSFLNVLFLAGLAGAALPVAIHLLNRERPRTQPFGWIALLDRAHRSETRRFRLREILLLILRGLLCALLALAFARPFFAGDPAEGAALPDHAAIVLDVSGSMRAGPRWEAARRQAAALVDRQPEGARVCLIAAARAPRIAADFTEDHAAVRAAVGGLEPGYESTDLGAAFRLAEARLRASEAGRRSLFVISDHQAAGWEALDLGDRAAPGIEVELLDAGGGEANAAVAGLRSTLSDGEVGVAARLRNYGPDPRELTVRLAVEGEVVDTRRARVPPRSAVDLAFEDVLAGRPGAGAAGAWVEIDDGTLEADDRRYLALEGPSRHRALCVGGTSPGEAAFFLMRALNPWGRPHGDVERPRAVRPSALTAAALDGADVVFLAGTGRLPAAALPGLRAFVEAGGGLVVSSGKEGVPDLGDLLPAVPEGRVQVSEEEEGFALLTGIDYGHPLFTPFRSGRRGDFGQVRVFAYTRLRVPDAAGVLMRFDGGDPALVEREAGAGRVLLFASSFDTSWTDLPKKALFAPFLHQVMGYLSRPRQAATGEYLVGHRPEAGGEVYDRPGLFTEEGGPRLVAVNVDPRESDLRRADLDEILRRLQPQPGEDPAPDPGEPDLAGPGADESLQLERQQRLWWWLMWAVLGLALGEMALANRTR